MQEISEENKKSIEHLEKSIELAKMPDCEVKILGVEYFTAPIFIIKIAVKRKESKQ